jgi:maleylpyruvate isomerase
MFRLYSHYRSSASYRVRIALHHKRIHFELLPVNLLKGEQRFAAHLQRNPIGQVPVLEVDEQGAHLSLTQSLPIMEYLEERFPDPPLLPADRFSRARSRELAEMVNSGIQPLQNVATLDRVRRELGGDGDAWARHFVARGLEALEERARTTAKMFMVGDAPTIADVCLVPQLYAARRFAVPLERFPTLTRIDELCRALPGWELAHPDRQPDAPR